MTGCQCPADSQFSLVGTAVAGYFFSLDKPSHSNSKDAAARCAQFSKSLQLLATAHHTEVQDLRRQIYELQTAFRLEGSTYHRRIAHRAPSRPLRSCPKGHASIIGGLSKKQRESIEPDRQALSRACHVADIIMEFDSLNPMETSQKDRHAAQRAPDASHEEVFWEAYSQIQQMYSEFKDLQEAAHLLKAENTWLCNQLKHTCNRELTEPLPKPKLPQSARAAPLRQPESMHEMGCD